MSIFRQLRWRIVGAQMLVVIVGVATLGLMLRVIILGTTPADLQPYLTALIESDAPDALGRTTKDLLGLFERTAITSVAIAAVAATAAGLIASVLLAREILRPLHEITATSRRIANGHYGERVTVPASNELATVAENFNQMADALEHIEEQRVTLIGNVAHELRTPLAGIEGYLEGLMDGLFPADSETFGHMHREVRRLHRLIDDLQQLSRVEAGEIALDLNGFDLIPLVEQTVMQIKPQAVEHCIAIDTAFPQTSLPVYADRDRTAQVLLNLLSNALHYTPEDGCITIHVSSGDGTASVAVEDTGLGIPEEELPFLFERFYRVDHSRSRKSGGSGIGLTISRHLIWAMGGELTAHSEGIGTGSTFTFTLPLA